MTLGQRVAAARQRAGLSQHELAQLAGIPRSTLSGIEANDKQPRTATLTALARALSVSLDDLMDHRAVVISIQENERNLSDVIREVSTILESAMTLSAGIRKQTELRSAEARDLSDSFTGLALATTSQSEAIRRLAEEVASLRDRVFAIEQAPPNYAEPVPQIAPSLGRGRKAARAASLVDGDAEK